MSKIKQKIPEGWSVKKLGEISQVITGSTPQTLDVTNYGKEFLFVSPADINDNVKYITDTTTKLSSKGFSLCRIIKKGSPMFVCIGSTIGKTALAGIDLATNQQINSCIVKNCINNEFLYYNLSFQSNKIRLLAGEQAVPIINKSTFEKIKLSIPPLAEQEKIAGILGTWDEAIEKLSDLIEHKKLLKKGLMQKLLTGKVRLNGFTQPWNEVKLGEIFNIKKGQGLSKDVLDSKGVYKCILYGELYTKYSEVIKNTISRTNKNEKITSNIGDLLIPASTTTSGIDLANATALLESDVILGGDINILRSKKEISPVFFAYLLTHSYKFDIARLAQGITIVHLYAEFLKSMKVFVPIDTNEQKAIADVLSTADEEIDLLNQKLDALKEQKKGLMQQLLTGQTRVKVN